MKKAFMFILIALMGWSVCHAQYTEKKYVIALGNFDGSHGDILRNAVTSSAAKCRISVNLINWEEVKGDSLMAASVDYILSGNASDIRVKSDNYNGKTYYTCTLPFSLTLTNPTTGQVVDSRSNDRKSSNTTSQSAANACAKLDDSVEPEYFGLIYKNCPIRVPIMVVQDVTKRGIVETVVINGGSDIGIMDGLTFDVQMESEIAGKKIYKNIGEAKVKEILSGEITLCQINKGNKEITKMLDDDITVVLTSNTKTTFGEDAKKLFNDVFH